MTTNIQRGDIIEHTKTGRKGIVVKVDPDEHIHVWFGKFDKDSELHIVFISRYAWLKVS